ncbi:SdpI family protein [Methanoregula sp.]|jgi:uncharacterized membrane protein|uniref:SdpI family protein n=1 Tax=Methanoregula sp. TaxID=2052170 RepID=UPI003C15BDED
MTRVAEVIRGWLGWCPNAHALRTTPPVFAIPPVTVHPAQPDGGAGGPGRRLIRPAIILVLFLTAVVTILLYPSMPDLVTSHWNTAGDVNGTMPKFQGLLLIPLLMYGFCALLLVLPRIDPLRKNYRKFQDYYDGFILVFAAFLFIIQLQIILGGLGIHVSPNVTMPVMIGILFIYTSFLLEHAEPNWFVGIRTPWTLSSTSVWKKTHQKGATLFKLAGVVSMIGVLAGMYAWLFILIPAVAVAGYMIVYSYIEFKREQAGTAG